MKIVKWRGRSNVEEDEVGERGIEKFKDSALSLVLEKYGKDKE